LYAANRLVVSPRESEARRVDYTASASCSAITGGSANLATALAKVSG
jgi:hypothetical protein